MLNRLFQVLYFLAFGWFTLISWMIINRDWNPYPSLTTIDYVMPIVFALAPAIALSLIDYVIRAGKA